MLENELNAVDGETLWDMELGAPRFCINSLLPQGLCVMGGASKIGKSWLVLDWVDKVAKGEPSNTNVIQISREADTRRSYKQTYNAYKRGLRHNKMLLLRALCERMDNNIKIRNSLIRQGATQEEIYYETEMEIECLTQEVSEVSWKGFLDGEIDLADVS